VGPDLRRRLTNWAGIGLVVVLLAIGGVVGYRAYQDAERSELQRALAWTPDASERYSWTDWDAVREQLDTSVDAGSSGLELAEMLNEGYDADLTSTTAMAESVEVLQDEFGVSPATVSWELLSQSQDGSVLSLGMPHEFGFDDLEDTLASLGYEEPDSETGVWAGGDELIATIAAGGSISPQFSHWAIDREQHLLLASDDEAYLARAVESVDEEGGGADVAEVAAQVGDPLSAVLLDADQACRSLAMSQADTTDQSTAAELVAAAGEVSPLTGFAMAAQPDGVVRAVLSFETEEQARTNADTRATLASGPAPGQGGEFADRFTLGEVVADGTVVTMDLEPVEGAFVLSDLSSGPLLFATC
jgi:hypothetical protein